MLAIYIYLTFKIPALRRIQRAECLQIPALIFLPSPNLEVNVPMFHLCRCFSPCCRKKWVIPSQFQPLQLNSHDLLLVHLIKNAFNNFILIGQLKSMVKVAYFRMFDLNSVHCIDIGVMMICQHFVNDQKRLITGPWDFRHILIIFFVFKFREPAAEKYSVTVSLVLTAAHSFDLLAKVSLYTYDWEQRAAGSGAGRPQS